MPEQTRQFRSCPAGAGGLLLENLAAAGGAQLAQLRLEVLALGGDLGVAKPRIAPLRLSTLVCKS